jgi:hypothetical protein
MVDLAMQRPRLRWCSAEMLPAMDYHDAPAAIPETSRDVPLMRIAR